MIKYILFQYLNGVNKMINKTVEFDLQIGRANIWLRKSAVFSISDNIQVFAKFYFLWSAFNSLYNLAYDENIDEKSRIKSLLNLLSEADAESIINIDNCNYLMNIEEPVKNEGHHMLMIYNGLYRENLRNRNYDEKKYNRIYASKNADLKSKLNAVFLTIYQIRNNLTHGNKSGDLRDKLLVKSAIPIIKNTIKLLLKHLKES